MMSNENETQEQQTPSSAREKEEASVTSCHHALQQIDDCDSPTARHIEEGQGQLTAHDKKLRQSSNTMDTTNENTCDMFCSLLSPTDSMRTAETIDEDLDESIHNMPHLPHSPSNLKSEAGSRLKLDAEIEMSPKRRKAMKNAERFQHWQQHTHAVGLGPISWLDEDGDKDDVDELTVVCTADTEVKNLSVMDMDRCIDKRFLNVCTEGFREKGPPPFCKRLGRVGNMVVLKERNTWILLPTIDCNDGNSITIEHGTVNATAAANPSDAAIAIAIATANSSDASTGVSQRHFNLLLGPYWPRLFSFTLPLVLGVSAITAFHVFSFKHQRSSFIISLWITSTLGMIISLLYTSFVDPGILPRHRERPSGTKNWRWNDAAQSFIPPSAVYEPACKVVIEQYDHTCIYTGTAIGKNNKTSFRLFVFFTVFCLIEDIVLLILRK